MHVLSVNIGKAEPMQEAKPSGRTGIYKHGVSTPWAVTSLGLTGDAVCDKKHHGGPDQAVYVYGAADYAWWSEQLGRELAPGTFGDNITITDLESARFSIGDRLVMNEVVLEVTAPRIPCVTLARRMDDSAFVKKFRDAERPGLYCRVIREGMVQAGESVQLQPYTGETITTLEMFRDAHARKHDLATLQRQLAAPIAERARADVERQLQTLLTRQKSAAV